MERVRTSDDTNRLESNEVNKRKKKKDKMRRFRGRYRVGSRLPRIQNADKRQGSADKSIK